MSPADMQQLINLDKQKKHTLLESLQHCKLTVEAKADLIPILIALLEARSIAYMLAHSYDHDSTPMPRWLDLARSWKP